MRVTMPRSEMPKPTRPAPKEDAPAPARGRSAAAATAGPWAKLTPSGRALFVGDFLTTLVSYAGNALRRHITLPYAEQFGLTVSEWRMLSVLAHAGELPFSELVMQAATDKAQVSRTLRLMEARGLVKIEVQGRTRGQKLTCLITRQGLALYRRVMPIAQRRQAAMILQLSAQERTVLYRALKKLRQLCEEADQAGAAGKTPATKRRR